jgi:hypothetical protein
MIGLLGNRNEEDARTIPIFIWLAADISLDAGRERGLGSGAAAQLKY